MKYVFRKKRYLILASLLDAVGYGLQILGRRRPPMAGRHFKNILIVRMDHLGDVLLSTAVPKLIKEYYPEARLTFLTSGWAAPLLEGNPFVDDVLTFDAPWFLQKRYQKSPSSPDYFSLARILKKKRFDLAIGLRGDIRENILLWLSGVSERIGYGVTGGGFFLTKEAHYRQRIHERDRLVNLLRPLGIRGEGFESRIYLTDQETSSAQEKLGIFGIPPGGRVIGFQCGAGAASKDWPAESVLEFLKSVGKEFPRHKVALVGTRSNMSELEEARKLAHCVDLVGKTSLRELCAMITRFDFFVGPDSGPTHIAATLGVPTLFFFSGTNRFEEWRPLAESASVLRHQVPCSPCGLRDCPVPGHPCMSRITVADALEVLKSRLAP